MNNILEDDVKQFAKEFQLKDKLEGKTILITGATGLIGQVMIRCLITANKTVKIIAPVRNIAKAQALLTDIVDDITLMETELTELSLDAIPKVDYLIHCAAPTASRYFVEHPVETYRSIHDITGHLLNEAYHNSVERFVYLSSLEVYGTLTDDKKPVTEDVQGYIDPLNVRSSYPIAKRATECLCHLYAKQYGMNVTIARLTQTTGAGIAIDDNRVIAQFARLAAHHEDIVLHTTGESARPYCYTTDAVSGILYVLLNGKSGEAYNIANPNTYISAHDMAMYLKQNMANDINVLVEISDSNCYAPPTRLRLSADKLMALGWQPHYGLKEIFEKLISYLS